ncbi:hypothetical protein Tco_1089320 [Tanacetum coccineum]
MLPSTLTIVLNKGKPIWKPNGRPADNILYKDPAGLWKATGKLFTDIGYQWRPTGKKLALGKLDCGYQWRPTGKKFALGEMCHLTKLFVKCSTLYANQQDPNKNWGTEIPNSANSTVFKCRSYSSSVSPDSRRTLKEQSLVMEIMLLGDTVNLQSILRRAIESTKKRTHRYNRTIHVTFDELHQSMAPVRMSSGPEPIIMTPGQLNSGLAPTDKELEMLFQPMFDEYIEQISSPMNQITILLRINSSSCSTRYIFVFNDYSKATVDKCFIVTSRYTTSSLTSRNCRRNPLTRRHRQQSRCSLSPIT